MLKRGARWVMRLSREAIPERRTVMLAGMRISAGFVVLAIAGYLPALLRPTINFFGNMLFFVGVFGLLGPVENVFSGGVLDKVESLFKRTGE
ncbi:MAG: hypothetical protein EHM35_04390 [Planctomycetaceae bacterium]|nr:MAG: hypothetical protein EHM35_04390 [Planctomycetaceae bacterium]